MLKNKLLIFPTTRSIRAYISLVNNVLLPDILTIGNFFDKVIFSEKNFIYDEKILLLQQSIDFKELKKLGIPDGFSHFINQSDYIFRFFKELSSEFVSIDDLNTSDTYGFYENHLMILKNIFEKYKKILDKNNLVDDITIVNNYKLNLNFLKKYDIIEIFLEGYLTNFEFKILKDISKHTNLVINLVSNKYNKKLIEKFNLNLKENFKYKINFDKILLEEKLTSNPNIIIKSFNQRTNQIAFINWAIYDMVVNKKLDPNKIAVVLPDESFVDIIKLYDNGYFNYAMGHNIFNTKLYLTLQSINLFLLERNRVNSIRIKDIDNLEFFEKNWNKNLTLEIFDEFIQYLISFINSEELLDKFNEIVFKLRLIFKNQVILFKDFFKIFFQKISEIRLDDTYGGKVTILGVLETRAVEFDGVIIIDFNDDYIPRISIKDKFLSTEVKQRANLPTNLNRQDLQKYYYKRILDNSKNIYISYVNNDEVNISRFAYDLFKNYNLSKNISDRTFSNILYKQTNLMIKDRDIIEMTPKKFSATSLKVFLDCKRKYLYRYIYKIKPHSINLRPKPYELGLAIHNGLKFWKDNDKEVVLNNIKSDNIFLKLDIEVSKKKLNKFFEIDNKEDIIKTELYFEFDYKNIKFSGRVDRIEKSNNYKILDYKTNISYNKNDFQLEIYYLAFKDRYKDLEVGYYDVFEVKKQMKKKLKLDELDEIIDNLEEKTNYILTDDLNICRLCEYNIICNRT